MAHAPPDSDHESDTLAAPGVARPGEAAGQSGVVERAFDARAEADAPLLVAGRYEILSLLGSGGMGTVYRARDVELDEHVALKVLRRELLDAPGMVARFRSEAKLARRVTHRNVARVFDITEHEGERFLTMELIDGEPLSTSLARGGPQPLERAIAIAADVAAGLAAAHAAGVVHRDLKPDNVLLAKDGRAVITDFGVARAFTGALAMSSAAGALLGTPAYMAPEQVEGKRDIDARADVYAFGALLFELVTGRRAWPGSSPFVVASSRLFEPPPDPLAIRPDLPPALAALAVRCMARKPDDRPRSVVEVAEALAAVDASQKAIGPSASAVRALPPDASEEPRSITPPIPMPGDKTVAVLPFRNAGDPEGDYLAEELTDDLIDALSMTRGLKVRSRGAVARSLGHDTDLREVGKDLGVQVIVTGSVRRAGDRVKITARLVSVGDGFQLWAARFERPMKDVLVINDEVAHAIAAALTLDAAASRDAPSDPLAIDLYVRARHEYRKFWPEHLDHAIELFHRAAAIAPRDPAILAGLASALARLVFFRGDERLAEAREAANRAVVAAPNLGEPHLALGSVLFQAGDPCGAVRSLRRAIAMGPGLAEAHASLGRILAEIDALDLAIPRLEAALALDPEAPLARPELMRAYGLSGKWRRADEIARDHPGDEGSAGYWTLRARMAIWRGRRDDAIGFLDKITGATAFAAVLAREAIETGAIPERAREPLRLASMSGGSVRRSCFFLQVAAELAAHFGERDVALDAIAHAAEIGLLDRAWLERCPLFESYRDDPRFFRARDLVRERAAEVVAAYRSG